MIRMICLLNAMALLVSMFFSRGMGDEPFPTDLALARKRLSDYEPVLVSPDGRFVAYTIVTPTRIAERGVGPFEDTPETAQGHRLYVADLANGKSVKVSRDESNAWAASWSPDGKSLAFLSDAGDSVGLWIYRHGAKADRVGSAIIHGRAHMRPQWSPDGKSLFVALAEPNQHRDEDDPLDDDTLDEEKTSAIKVRTSGAEISKDTDTEVATHFAMIDKPSSIGVVNVIDGIAKVLIPSDHESHPAGARLSPSGKFLLIESPLISPSGPLDEFVCNLSLLRLEDGAVVWMESGFRFDESAILADLTDSSRIATLWHPTRDKAVFAKGGKLYTLEAADKPSASEIDLGGDYYVSGATAFSRDNKSIVVPVRAADSKSEKSDIEKVLLVPLDGGEVKTLAIPTGVKLKRVVKADARTAWQPRESDVIFVGTKSGEPVYVRMTTETSQASVVPVNGCLTVRSAAASDHNIAVGVLENLQTAPDLYVISSELQPGVRLSRIEPRLDNIQLGPVEFFETEVNVNAERKTVRSAIVLPAGAKKGDRLPTIVTLYPGADYSGFGLHYGGGDVSTIPTPLFTTRGYAVLLVDVPLTPEGQSSNPMEEIVGVVVPQVKRAAELGYTDLDRVAVTGQSYGGYGTACLASGTDLFAAAVPVAGVFDLAGLYAASAPEDEEDGTMTNMLWSEQSQGRMGKPLWDEPQRYIDNSPYFQADRIHTPLLIIHGQADTTCPVQESEKLFNALRRLERTAQLAVYEGEGHVPSEWSRENAADLVERVLAFLNRHLKSRSE